MWRSGCRILPCQEQRINGKASGLVRRVLGNRYHTTSRVPIEACPEVQQGCEKERIRRGRIGTLKGDRKHTGRQCRKASPDLEGAL